MLPDKIYLEEGHAEPVVGFVGPAWDSSKDKENTAVYIRKDALIKFVNKKLQESADRLDFHANRAYAEVLDKLNEM